MEVEHDIKVLPVNESLQGEIEKLAKEGWALVPGVQPVAIYHVVRPKHSTSHIMAPTGKAHLSIDDSRIHIMRNGEIIS